MGGDDVGAFFPVKVGFIAEGSLVDVAIDSVTRVDGSDDAVFSQEASVEVDEYLVV